MPGPWLVLPTYNEAENLEPLVRAAIDQLAFAAPAAHRVLVVDDDSPDGTGRVADRLAEELAVLEVLHRPSKAGLGSAYIEGFRRALAGGADLVMEMDSDFSHEPPHLPRLLPAPGHADLVLGSRYVAGGGVGGWGLGRRLLSRGGCRYARTVLGVDVRDLTGGFKCFRREVLETLELGGVRTDCYGFQIELTYRALRAGFRVVEVPIVFRERRTGASKMTPRIALEALWKVPALRVRPPRR
ncbi:MAG: polyprenol monophosphomannose synthase [Thermoleophilaceae bacterium]